MCPDPIHPRPADRAPDAVVPTRREAIVEELHGVPVPDPYRWLEDGESPEVRAWSAAQTARAERLLAARPGFDALRARLLALLSVGTVEPPIVVGGTLPRYFYRRQAVREDQPVLYVRGPDGAERALLDPNGWSRDGTVALDWWTPSWDARFVAYGVSEGGSEDSTLHVLDVATGQELGPTEVIPHTRYASAAWLPGGSGFFYARYPAKGQVPAGEELYHRRVYFHRLGEDPAADPVVFGADRPLADFPAVDVAPGGRWLVGSVSRGSSYREAWLRDGEAGPDAPWVPLAVPSGAAVYEVLAGDDALLVRTNEGAPTFALYRVDPKHPARRHWQLVLPPGPEVLAFAAAVGGEVLAVYLAGACARVRRFTRAGALVAEIPLPTLGTVRGITGQREGREAFFDFTAFAVPARVYRLDLDTGGLDVWADVGPPIDPDAFEVHQERAVSRDGTLIPYFLTHRRGLPRDGAAPTMITGYGGFSHSATPAWSGSRYAFLERGGVVATANLRGGGEYGEPWHRAGMLDQKQNVFDDVVAVAEHLVETRVTSPSRLAILGGSNGGLLVGAAITQRPDLFRAAVAQVPLLDMLRYHRFLMAQLWIAEYGSADDPTHFRWLSAYSPYHHVRDGTAYPAVLLATAEGDTRVDPLHARKMAARLEHARRPGSADHPVLLRIEDRAGHGAGKPISKRIDEAAYVYGFLLWQLGAEGGP
jgi:prolyl oligopeptidase